MKRSKLGWNDSLEEQFLRWSGSGLVPGRIVGEAGHAYDVETDEGRFNAVVSGHFQYIAACRADYPAVGDWVLLRGESDPLLIERVFERGGLFSRRAAGRKCDEQVIAANIDLMLIVAALDGGRNFTQHGIERYIVMVREGGARPVIILNKCDLCSESERSDYRSMASSVAGDIPVLMLSALTGEGMEQMHEFLTPGITAAFTGPSGSGKSALINYLLGKDIQRTGALREDDMRGRHTTTRRELFMLSGGAMVIDTPGLRELRPFGDTGSLDMAFAEISAAGGRCRFTDCSHTNEPGCEVLRLVSEGRIEFGRYQNFITIRNEMVSLEMMKSEQGRLQRKNRDKALSKLVKNYHKDHGK